LLPNFRAMNRSDGWNVLARFSAQAMSVRNGDGLTDISTALRQQRPSGKTLTKAHRAARRLKVKFLNGWADSSLSSGTTVQEAPVCD
jgi:hypothetical protein